MTFQRVNVLQLLLTEFHLACHCPVLDNVLHGPISYKAVCLTLRRWHEWEIRVLEVLPTGAWAAVCQRDVADHAAYCVVREHGRTVGADTQGPIAIIIELLDGEELVMASRSLSFSASISSSFCRPSATWHATVQCLTVSCMMRNASGYVLCSSLPAGLAYASS